MHCYYSRKMSDAEYVPLVDSGGGAEPLAFVDRLRAVHNQQDARAEQVACKAAADYLPRKRVYHNVAVLKDATAFLMRLIEHHAQNSNQLHIALDCSQRRDIPGFDALRRVVRQWSSDASLYRNHYFHKYWRNYLKQEFVLLLGHLSERTQLPIRNQYGLSIAEARRNHDTGLALGYGKDEGFALLAWW